jgi:penicillin-binding protein 1C
LPQRAPHLLETLAARHGPRRFQTTLDAALQQRTRDALDRHAARLATEGIHNAAVLVVDNATFEVRAYVGNASRGSDPPDAAVGAPRGEVASDPDGDGNGRAIDLLQRPRSTGSVLKPFLFALMLEAGEILPDVLVPDVPTRFGGFAPENADHRHRGAVPASLALARSLNVPAVRMLADHGVARFHAELEQLGLTTLHRTPAGYGLTLVLGGAEATPVELAGLYANLARTATSGPGEVPHQRALRLLRDDPPGPSRAQARYGPGAAWLTLDALTRVARPGTEGDWDAFADARRIAWKTGTSYGLRDAWAIGTTPETTVAVWVGNASGEGVAGLSGVGSAAPLLFEVFRALEVSDGFPIPDHDLRTVLVCADDGYLEAGGCETRPQLAPRHGHFARPSPHHRLVHLDAGGRYRVDSRCARVASMVTRSWLVLPPDQEYWYRQHAPHYRPLPPLHPDCAGQDESPIALVYPAEGAGIYVPVELRGDRGRAVFRAVHREPEAVLHWHLDDRYLGSTETFHDLEIDAPPGPHRLVLVDGDGRRLERRFELLGDARRGG